MKAFAIVGGLVGCGLIACGNPSTDALAPEVTRAFEEAFATDEPSAVAALFTDDAEILAQERSAVKGKQDIEEYLAAQISPVIMFDSTTEMSVVRGDYAFETGSYTFRDTRRGADIEYGKYMHVWRKDDDDWKIFRAMYNADEPLNAEVSVAHGSE